MAHYGKRFSTKHANYLYLLYKNIKGRTKASAIGERMAFYREPDGTADLHFSP
jgi:hypothetical protein